MSTVRSQALPCTVRAGAVARAYALCYTSGAPWITASILTGTLTPVDAAMPARIYVFRGLTITGVCKTWPHPSP
jgi:hypothetical protein